MYMYILCTYILCYAHSIGIIVLIALTLFCLSGLVVLGSPRFTNQNTARFSSRTNHYTSPWTYNSFSHPTACTETKLHVCFRPMFPLGYIFFIVIWQTNFVRQPICTLLLLGDSPSILLYIFVYFSYCQVD